MRLAQLLAALTLVLRASAAVLAIDYGAEFTKLSLVKPGVPFDVVLDRDSKRKIQSVVGWKREDRVFGQEAKLAVCPACLSCLIRFHKPVRSTAPVLAFRHVGRCKGPELTGVAGNKIPRDSLPIHQTSPRHHATPSASSLFLISQYIKRYPLLSPPLSTFSSPRHFLDAHMVSYSRPRSSDLVLPIPSRVSRGPRTNLPSCRHSALMVDTTSTEGVSRCARTARPHLPRNDRRRDWCCAKLRHDTYIS